MVVASIDADGPIIKHIQSAHPAANPTASYSTRTFHPMIRVDLSDTFARLIIAHVLLVSLMSFLARVQLHLARSLDAEKHRYPVLQTGRIPSTSAAESPRGGLPIAIAIAHSCGSS